MSTGKPVTIGEVAQQLDRFETVLPDAEYSLLGMRSKIGGPFVRETKRGDAISAQRLNRVQSGDFIYSRLFAWQGSFGLIPEEMDGCYVSNEFPIFRLDESRIEPKYLVYWFGLHHVQKIVEADCSGSTPGTRNRYKEDFFTALEFELPALEEQRRIVGEIESLAAKIDEAKQLRQAIQTDMDALLVAMAHRNDLSDDEKIAQGWERVALGEVLTQVSDPVDVEPGDEYPHFGIYSFAKGLFKKAPLLGDEIKATRLYRVHEGQFIYSRLKAFEGAFGAISPEYSGCHVSNEFPTFELDENRVTLGFLVAYTLSPQVWKAFAVHSKGVGARRERLKPENFLAEEIWLPPMDWQQKIKLTTEQLAASKTESESVGLELDALLPAILDRAFKGEL